MGGKKGFFVAQMFQIYVLMVLYVELGGDINIFEVSKFLDGFTILPQPWEKHIKKKHINVQEHHLKKNSEHIPHYSISNRRFSGGKVFCRFCLNLISSEGFMGSYILPV